jgi:nucleoside 2-deoxyribosyltransferase
MIASPGDVASERQIAKQIIYDWNDIHSLDRKTVLLPITWETHASPAMGDRAQAIINKQILGDADILIAIFWARIGTPTGVAASGTVEEITEHIAAGKPTMLYFSTAPIRQDSVDEDQYKSLQLFKKTVRDQNNGLYVEYESLSEFKEKLSRQLAQTIIREYPFWAPEINFGGGGSNQLPEPSSTPVQPISPEATQLLKESSLDPNGVILKVTTSDGTSIQTNGQDLVEDQNPRSLAKWRSALDELIKGGFVEQRDRKGEVFSITGAGFKIADTAV